MAYNNTISHSNVPTIKAPFAVIGGFFAAIWTGLVNMGANSGRMRQVTFLQSKTDEELSAMGIKREKIVPCLPRYILRLNVFQFDFERPECDLLGSFCVLR